MISRSTLVVLPAVLALVAASTDAAAQPAAPPAVAPAPAAAPPGPPAATPPVAPAPGAPAPPPGGTTPPAAAPPPAVPPPAAPLPAPPPGPLPAPVPPAAALPPMSMTGDSLGPPLDGRAEPASARLERLRRVLTEVDEQTDDAKVPVLVGSLAVGAVAIPTGAVMLGRDDDGQQIGGAVALGIGIGSVLGGVIQLFVNNGATLDMADELDDAVASGAPPEVVVRSVEQQWAQAAADIRTGRKISGVLSTGIGAIGLGVGTALAFVDTSEDFTSTEQAVTASALIATGALSMIGGLQVFFTESPQEVAWNTYAASNDLPEEPIIAAPRLELGAVPGGGGISFAGAF